MIKYIWVMIMNKYLNQDINNPKYLFHGSDKVLDELVIMQSNDSNGNSLNIDKAIFLTPSFIGATPYAFKETIKKNSNGLKWNFNIDYNNNIPVMTMKNVILDDDIIGYVYVFYNSNLFVNEPKGSLQYKSYTNLKPIDVVKVKYKDYKKYYKVI